MPFSLEKKISTEFPVALGVALILGLFAFAGRAVAQTMGATPPLDTLKKPGATRKIQRGVYGKATWRL